MESSGIIFPFIATPAVPQQSRVFGGVRGDPGTMRAGYKGRGTHVGAASCPRQDITVAVETNHRRVQEKEEKCRGGGGNGNGKEGGGLGWGGGVTTLSPSVVCPHGGGVLVRSAG